MTKNDIWLALSNSILEVMPELSNQEIKYTDSLSNLGANSIDRAEIIMLTMAKLKLKISLVNFAKGKNIGDIIDIYYSFK